MSRRKIGDSFLAKPLWMAAGVALLGIAGGLSALTAACGSEEVSVRQRQSATPIASVSLPVASLTPGPGVTLWRWMDVTLVLPEGAGVGASPTVFYFDAEGRQSVEAISVGKFDPENPAIFSQVQIDARKGTVLSSKILDQHRSELEVVLASMAVGPLNVSTAPWPYNGDPPADAARESSFGMSFVRPDPATGIIIEPQIGASARGGDGPPSECEVGEYSISVRNGRSSAHYWLDPVTNVLCKSESLNADDAAAFERLFSDIKRCDKEIPC